MGNFQRDIGKNLEDSVYTKLTVLRQQGIVSWFQKNEPAFRMRGVGFYQPTIASGADFSGFFADAASWVMETKSIGCDPKTGKLKEFTKEDRIPVTQMAHLEATARSGGLSLLVLQFRPNGAPWMLFAIPWLEVPWRKHRVRHYVTPEDLGAFKMPAHTMILDQFFKDPMGAGWMRAVS